jgi:hypothetical protein
MKGKQMKRKMEIVGAGVMAAVVIACGDAAMNGAGGMLNDAGEMMTDAGQTMMDAGGEMMRDAGQVMMDAGGEVMHDAGEIVRDAGEIMRDAGGVMRDGSTGMMDSASAQSCEACTASGRQMVVTADQDVEQLRGGTIEGAGWVGREGAMFTETNCDGPAQMYVLTAELGSGPFVITDFRAGNGVQLYSVAEAASCSELYTPDNIFIVTGCTIGGGAQARGERLRRPLVSRSLINSGIPEVTGARLFVPDGQKICVMAGGESVKFVGNPIPTTHLIAVWSGFVPYE